MFDYISIVFAERFIYKYCQSHLLVLFISSGPVLGNGFSDRSFVKRV